jgi:hypothetical protein
MGAEDAADEERRPEAGRRHRMLQQGRILVAPDRLVPCVIRDLSRTGAKIRVARDVDLPERFALYIAAHDLRSAAVRLRWRRGDFAGVAFEEEPQPTKL